MADVSTGDGTSETTATTTAKPSAFVEAFVENVLIVLKPKSQILHVVLFVIAASLTVWHSALDFNSNESVVLTNFEMLQVEDLAKDIADEKNFSKPQWNRKWKCTSHAVGPFSNATGQAYVLDDAWGPDSMCRCINASECVDATKDECKDVEKHCYKTVVPPYANVFAGLSQSNFNMLIAFMLMHISVWLSMVIETEDTRAEGISLDKPRTGEGETLLPPSQQLKTASVPWVANDMFVRGKRLNFGHELTELTPAVVQLGTHVQLGTNVQLGTPMIYVADNISHFVQHSYTRWTVFCLLTVVAFGLSIACVSVKNKLKGDDQTVTSYTNALLYLMSLLVCLLNMAWAVCLVIWKGAPWSDVQMTAHILEDFNITVAYMLLVSTFTALSGVHDDYTVLFDVMVIMFIAFILHVSEDIMHMREDVITYCKDRDFTFKDTLDKTHTVGGEVLAYILQTRLFIFAVMFGTSYIFIERIEPSTLASGTDSSWNYYMRNVVLLVMLLPHLWCDVSYEVMHAFTMRSTATHLGYEGPRWCRINVALAYIVFFNLVSLRRDTVLA